MVKAGQDDGLAAEAGHGVGVGQHGGGDPFHRDHPAPAVSSSGRTFDFVYADGTWSYTGRQSTVECVDGVTGAPLGEVVPSVIDTEFVPTTPVAADSTVAVAEFTGSSVETVPAPGCGSGASTYTSSFSAVRTGD
ncbi:MAG: hypothetical protein H0T85_03315 [Geodermatophilaceae bacterium]|nr:hypothetical protein [Geodermatophilaceae bacterium]